MFGLRQRLRYKAKRGMRVADRRVGLAALASHVASLKYAEPPLAAPRRAVDETVRGRALKAVEDALDATICAWVASLWSRCPDRVRVFGDPDGAHIAVPVGMAQPTG
jgi:predicted RNase H-like nuclease